MNPFQPGGVTPNPQGYAYGQPMNSGLSMLAQMQLLKGFSGDSFSSSSSSSKISIVKYDDHFKEKGWCEKNLVKPWANGVSPKFTAEEIKKNPPLALKFSNKDCEVLIPIPSHEAMCTTTQAMVKKYLGAGYASATSEAKKNAAIAISKSLLFNFVEECGYGDRVLGNDCLGLGPTVEGTLPDQTTGVAPGQGNNIHDRAVRFS